MRTNLLRPIGSVVGFSLCLLFILLQADSGWSQSSLYLTGREHEDFIRGEELLSRAQFKAALLAFKAAAEAEPKNEKYREERDTLERIVETRAAIQKEKSLHRWNVQAKLLHAYYLRKSLHAHLIDIDQRIFEKQPTPWITG